MAGQNKERNYAMNKILIIDDDRELCALIKRSVQSEHIEADFCNTGKEGLQKLKEQEYQLVVLDVMTVSYTHLPLLFHPAARGHRNLPEAAG